MRKIKRCKYCGAKNIDISHFGRKHQKQIQAARHRRKSGKGSKTHRKGSGGTGSRSRLRTFLNGLSRTQLAMLLTMLRLMVKPKKRKRHR